MILFWRCFWGIFFIVCIAMLNHCIQLPDFTQSTKFGNETDIIDSRPTFWLSDDSWLTFELLQHKTEIRVFSHPAITEDVPPWERINYEIDYEFLDGNRDLLFKNRYHHSTTNLPSYRDKDGTIVKARSYAKAEELNPTLDQNFLINLKNYPQAHFLRLKSVKPAAPIKKIGIRLFQQLLRTDEDASLSWHRLSSEKKAQLTDHHIYPINLVSANEKLHVMSRYWLPLGPMGIEDEDYSMDKVYLYPYTEFPRENQSISHTHYFVGPNKHLTFALENNQQNIRLLFNAIGPTTQSATIELHWQDAQTYESYYQTLKIDDLSTQQIFSQNYGKGLLEITSDTGFEARLILDSQEINDNNYLKAVRVDALTPIEYETPLDPQSPKVYKFDFRLFTHELDPPAGKPAEVIISIYDKDGESISESTHSISSLPSLYERFLDYRFSSQISEKQSIYVKVSGNARRINIASNQPILLNTYNRPYLFPIQRTLPRDDNRWFNREERIPAWFPVKPANWERIVKLNRAKTLVWQHRPAVIEPHIETGEYTWEALTPTAPNLLQQTILVPQERNSTVEIRDQALLSWFRPISNTAQLVFRSQYNEQFTQPSLIFKRANDNAIRVNVEVDNQLLKSLYIAGKSGKVSLPPISAGKHTLSIISQGKPENISWFINSVKIEDKAYIERTAYEIPPSGIEITLNKTIDPSLITWHFFSTTRQPEVNLAFNFLTTDKPSPYDSYTLRQQHYTLQQTTAPPPVLIRQNDEISITAKISTSLQGDTINGPQTILMVPRTPGRHFVLPYIILPGEENYQLFKNLQSDFNNAY